MPNAVSLGGILVPAPWKWCRMIDEQGEVRLSTRKSAPTLRVHRPTGTRYSQRASTFTEHCRIGVRSRTRPPSRKARPTQSWPPLRTDTGSPVARAARKIIPKVNFRCSPARPKMLHNLFSGPIYGVEQGRDGEGIQMDEPVLFWSVRGQYMVIYLPDTESFGRACAINSSSL